MLETETLQNHWIEIISLVVAIGGIGLLVRQLGDVRRTITIQGEQLKAQALGTLYGHYFDYCRALLEKPHLRAHIYNNPRVSAAPIDHVTRAEIETLCELLTGILEEAEVQKPNLPGDTYDNCWRPLLEDMYRDPKAGMAEFYRVHRRWYSESFRSRVDELLEPKSATSETR
jgi:hypothetical protein